MPKIIIAAAFLAVAVTTPSFAQSQKKAGAKCQSLEACIASCSKAGGQGRLCPQYCEKRRQEKGC